jgi:hypothetical protein
LTLPYSGQTTTNSGGTAFEVENLAVGGSAVYGIGGLNDGSVVFGGPGLWGNGGATLGVFGRGGSGVFGQGGAPVVANSVGGFGGDFTGGGADANLTAIAGAGVSAIGGDASLAGAGVVTQGGNGSTGGEAGDGIDAYFGDGPSDNLNYGLAAYLAGPVTVTGTLNKPGGSFVIDHPTDPEHKYLYHSFVESPDMKNIYDGDVVTDGSGTAVVKMPDWFEALNRDFRYQLTVIGQFAQAIVASKIANGQFVIKTDKPGVEVSWQVTGIRQDAWANAHRIPLEVEKAPEDQGHYLHPELYGHAGEPDIHGLHHPRPVRQNR